MATSTIYKKATPKLRQLIVETIHKVLDDPDFGRDLSERAKRRLRQARNYRGPYISLEQIKKKYY